MVVETVSCWCSRLSYTKPENVPSTLLSEFVVSTMTVS